jgi:hypothetical protein
MTITKEKVGGAVLCYYDLEAMIAQSWQGDQLHGQFAGNSKIRLVTDCRRTTRVRKIVGCHTTYKLELQANSMLVGTNHDHIIRMFVCVNRFLINSELSSL